MAVACLLLLAPLTAFAGNEPGSPRLRLTAADNRRARSALILRSDLIPGFRSAPASKGAPGIPHCADYPGDRSRVIITGEAQSSFLLGRDTFSGRNTIGSRTIFFKSYSDLDRYWRLTVKPRYITCGTELYASGLPPGIQGKTLLARPIPLGPTGAEKGVAFRSIFQLSDGSNTVDLYDTVVFIRSGRAMSMILVHYHDQPCECQTGLARLLALRLIKATH